LGERLNGIQEVGGSIPPGSTKFFLENLRTLRAAITRAVLAVLAPVITGSPVSPNVAIWSPLIVQSDLWRDFPCARLES
jgi:hypothetical protein